MRKFIKSNSFISQSVNKPEELTQNVKILEKNKIIDISQSNYLRLLKQHEQIKSKFNHFF